jgi:hypothetical protein
MVYITLRPTLPLGNSSQEDKVYKLKSFIKYETNYIQRKKERDKERT